MSNKPILEQFFGLPMEGDFDALMTVLGDTFDQVEDRIADLLEEVLPSTATIAETLQQWLNDYGLAFDSVDTTDWKRQVLLAKINELGGMSIPYYVNLAARFDEVISLNDSLVFKFGDKFGGTFYGSEHVHSFTITLAEQHLFPFKFGDKFGGKFVSIDKRNSMEALLLRLKPAHTKIFFHYFNWGFETGDLSEWIPVNDVIDNVTVRTGTYSSKLAADGTVSFLDGLKSHPIIIAENRKYQIDSYHNIPVYVAGVYQLEIDYYSDFNGENSLGSNTIFAKTGITTGWERGIKTIAPLDIESDLDFPATTKSFRISKAWKPSGGNPDGEAFIDDIDISLI